MIDLEGAVKNLHGLISFRGTTTANGAVGGTSLVCSDLTLMPEYNGNLVVITSGTYRGQARDIDGTTLAGTVTPHSAFGGQIVTGTEFIIFALRLTPAEVADIEEKLDLVPIGGTFIYLDAGGEQAAFTIAPARPLRLNTIWLDLVNLTQNTTIRIYHQIDGANYRVFETFNWTVGMDDGVYFRNIAIDNARNLQLTFQEAADEGADRNIPYYYAYEPR
jgi:hypothetical protein